jgi:hypothetical protein
MSSLGLASKFLWRSRVEGFARFSNSRCSIQERDSVLEARLSLGRGDLLLGFDSGDDPAHLSIRTTLVEEAVANPTASFLPAPVRARHEPCPSEAALSLASGRIPPLRFVERHALVCPDDQGAALLAIELHLEPPGPEISS